MGGGATGGGGNPSRRSFSTRLRNQWKPTFALEAMVCNRSSAMVEKDCENWTEPKIPVKAAVEGEDRGGDVRRREEKSDGEMDERDVERETHHEGSRGGRSGEADDVLDPLIPYLVVESVETSVRLEGVEFPPGGSNVFPRVSEGSFEEDQQNAMGFQGRRIQDVLAHSGGPEVATLSPISVSRSDLRMCIHASGVSDSSVYLPAAHVEVAQIPVGQGDQCDILCGRLAHIGGQQTKNGVDGSAFCDRNGELRDSSEPEEDDDGSKSEVRFPGHQLRPSEEENNGPNRETTGSRESSVEAVRQGVCVSKRTTIVSGENKLCSDCNRVRKIEDRCSDEVEEQVVERDKELGCEGGVTRSSSERAVMVEESEERGDEERVEKRRRRKKGSRWSRTRNGRRPERLGCKVESGEKRKRVERSVGRVFEDVEEWEFEHSGVDGAIVRLKAKRKRVEEESCHLDDRLRGSSVICAESVRISSPPVLDVSKNSFSIMEVEDQVEDCCGERRRDSGSRSPVKTGVDEARWPPLDLKLDLVLSDPSSLSPDAIKLLVATTSDKVLKRKRKRWEEFVNFVRENSEGVVSPEVVCSFLADRLYAKEQARGSLSSWKSDLMTTIKIVYSVDWSAHPLVKAITKSIKKLSRPKAKYSSMWDIAKLYNYFRENPVSSSRLNLLRAKASVLVRASLAARAKDVHRIARSSVKFTASKVSFRFFAWKQQNEDDFQLSSEFYIEKLGDEDSSICAYTALKVYMTANKAYYDSDLGRAHNYIWTKYNSGVAIVSNTVSSDSRKMMELAGINVRVYGAATIRHAAISKWRMMGLPRERVAERTFHRSLNIISFYYDKSVITDLNASLVTERGRDAVYFDKMEESEEEFWMEDG